MHREQDKLNGVYVYLRSNRISLLSRLKRCLVPGFELDNIDPALCNIFHQNPFCDIYCAQICFFDKDYPKWIAITRSGPWPKVNFKIGHLANDFMAAIFLAKTKQSDQETNYNCSIKTQLFFVFNQKFTNSSPYFAFKTVKLWVLLS